MPCGDKSSSYPYQSLIIITFCWSISSIKERSARIPAMSWSDMQWWYHWNSECSLFLNIIYIFFFMYSFLLFWANYLSCFFSTLSFLCCDLAGSVISRQHWLWDTARKRNAFLLFSIVLRIFQFLELLVRISWGFQQNVPLLMSTSIK